jgi:hypothetical protein
MSERLDFYLKASREQTFSLVASRAELLKFAGALQQSVELLPIEQIEREGAVKILAPLADSWRIGQQEFYFQVWACGSSGPPPEFQKISDRIPFWLAATVVTLALIGALSLASFSLRSLA